MLSANFVSHVPDAPLQEHEIRALPRCANCPFAETDKDDGKLYCHASAPKAQAVFYFLPPGQKKPVITPIGPSPQPMAAPELVVHGIVTYWPEVQPEWRCWQHPKLQTERRRLENGL